jgi:hypothetical protein
MERTMKIMKIMLISLCLITIAMSNINAQPRPTRPTNPNTNTGQENPRPSRGQITASFQYSKELLTEPFILKKGELLVTGDDVTKREAFVAAIAKSDAVIAEYLAKVDEFLATNPNMSLYTVDLSRVRNKAKSVEGNYGHIKKAEKEFNTGNSLGGVYYLQNLYIYKGFLQGVTKIFPADEPLQNYLKQVTEAIESYGSREKFMDKMVANQRKQAENMRMVPAAMSNPKIEALVKTKYEAAFPGFKVLKVNITNNPWILEKNDLGIPLYKRSSVSVGVKNDKGECGIGSANVRQDYEGGGTYGAVYMYLPSDPIIVPCENIK